MRIVLSALVLLALIGSAQSREWPGPVDCAKAKFEPELTLCRDPQIHKADTEIAAAYLQLRDRFAGHERKIFVAGQTYWSVTRNGCVQRGSNYGLNKDLLACLKSETDKQLTFLRALLADPSLLMSSTSNYTNIDPWYFNEFGKEYAGRSIKLYGWIEGIACRQPPGPAKARIAEEGVAAPVMFSELGQTDINFLCGKRPGGYWDGEVRLDAAGHPYLYATAIFGTAIPYADPENKQP